MKQGDQKTSRKASTSADGVRIRGHETKVCDISGMRPWIRISEKRKKWKHVRRVKQKVRLASMRLA